MTPKSILPALTLAVASILSLDAHARQEQDAVTPSPVDQGRQTAFLERAKDKQIQIVFLGDSITDGWQGTGKAVWERYYAKHDAADFGVSGERTEQTLGHIAGGILDGLNPKVVVIMIGTNNIGHSAEEKPEWAAAGVKKIVTTVHEKLPNAKVLLLAVFPRDQKDSDHRKAVNGINAIIPLTIEDAFALSRAAMRAAVAGDMSTAGLRRAQRLSRRQKSA